MTLRNPVKVHNPMHIENKNNHLFFEFRRARQPSRTLSSRPSWQHLNHWKTCARDKHWLAHASLNKWWISVADIQSLKRNVVVFLKPSSFSRWNTKTGAETNEGYGQTNRNTAKFSGDNQYRRLRATRLLVVKI